jgi:hypothetical protein
MTETRLKHIVAGVAALVAFITYALTMAPTVSFWDCGEFVAASNTMGIPHPPGSPLFMLLGRFAIVTMPFISEIAQRVNYLSVISSSLAIFLTALFTWDVMAKVLDSGKDKLPDAISRHFVLIVSALTASFLLTFSDTFWFNAVEAEVYGFGMTFVLLISYLALKWVDFRNTPMGNSILLLICYLGFLGIGVHLYSMLPIPLIMILLLVYSEPGKRLERWPVFVTGTVLYSVVYAADRLFSWSLILLAILLVVQFIASGELRKQFRFSMALIVFALIGYSMYLYIPVRSSLNPIIDENNPEVSVRDEKGNLALGKLLDSQNWKAFNDFIERKQYGSESMIVRAFNRRSQPEHQFLSYPNLGYGGYQLAQYSPFKVGQVNFYDQGLYSTDAEDNPPLTRGSISFPTQMMMMGSNIPMQLFWFVLLNGLIALALVAMWKRNRPISMYVASLYVVSSFGLLFYLNFSDGTRVEKRDLDQWSESIARDNSMMSERGMTLPPVPNGNELLGIRLKMSLAKTDAERNDMARDPAWQAWQSIQGAYKNAGYQPPSLPNPVHMEVRERDYFFAPGFVFMSIIFGLGCGMLLVFLVRERKSLVRPVGFAALIICFAVPSFANFKEHNRSGNWIAWDYAYNLLMSCQPNSVLFTNGDNDTFPLWFAQEVANIRRDVRVVNLSLGNTDWYIKQIKSNAPTMKLSYTDGEIDSRMVFSEDNMRDESHQVDWWVTKAKAGLPVLQAQISELQGKLDSATTESDKATLKARLLGRSELFQVYDALVVWGTARKGGFMKTQDKLVLDLALNNLDRPLHFSNTVATSNFVGLEKYMIQEGMVFTLQRGNLKVEADKIDLQRTQFLVDSVYQYRGIGDGTTYVNSETERLLFNYNTLYIRLALETRNDVMRLSQQKAMLLAQKDSTGASNSADYDRKIQEAKNMGAKYCDMGIKQFPSEWRNYAVAAELMEAVGDRAKALAYLEKGQANIQGKAKEEMSRRLEYFQGDKAKQ